MAHKKLAEDVFRAVLSKNLNPSAGVKIPEHLRGREAYLRQISRALNSPGRQIVIHGDRGIGKTSLALIASRLFNASQSAPIYIVCSQNNTFADVMRAICNAVGDSPERFEQGVTPPNIAGRGPGGIGASDAGLWPMHRLSSPESLNDALQVLQYVMARRTGRIVIVVDEMEGIASDSEKMKFAELMRNVPEVTDRVRFIFCGLSAVMTEITEYHPSLGRIVEPIRLGRVGKEDLVRIVSTVAAKLQVGVERGILERISQLSDGFPYYTHLIGEALFWNVFDDAGDVAQAGWPHLRSAIRNVLERAEINLRRQYDRATTGGSARESEGLLWALADGICDQREAREIYDSSYLRVAAARSGTDVLSFDAFKRRLLALRKDDDRGLISGSGSSFWFRENIMRGYVRMQAEGEGVLIGIA